MAEEDDYNQMGREPISSLLCIPRSGHKAWDIVDNAEQYIVPRAHKPLLKYDQRCAPYHKNVGLYEFARIEHVNTDPRLITALVERWRPETHTFHLPVGEMTVTLEDVSCLWGLPITGDVVIGDSDTDLPGLVDRCLGPSKCQQVVYTKRQTRDGAEEVVYCDFRISLHLLRVHTQPLGVLATEEEILRYTRAYIMDLFGSVLFPDCTRDSVPVMYLRFLENMYPERVPSWGAAALACLYRNLTNASLRITKTIAGPLLLLQHWSWSRFNIARPKLKGARLSLGGPDPEERPPFAIKWYKYRSYEDNPARGSMLFYRTHFEALLDWQVVWQPYREVLQILPGRVYRDRPYWLARVPLICFWIVAWHYPERVMRQFGLYQSIPPPAPHSYEHELKKLDKVMHTNYRGGDWSVKHAAYLQSWVHPQGVMENRPYNSAEYLRYRRWFQEFSMYTVYIQGQVETGLSRPLLPPRDSVEVLGYVPGGFRLSRMGVRGIQRVKWIIKEMYKRGKKKLAKTLLTSHRDDAMDADTLHEFQRALIDADLPENVEELDSNEEAGTSYDPPRHSMPDVRQQYSFSGQDFSFSQFGPGPSQPSMQYTGPSQPVGGHGFGGIGGFGQFATGASNSSHPAGVYSYGGFGQFATSASSSAHPAGVYGYGGFVQPSTSGITFGGFTGTSFRPGGGYNPTFGGFGQACTGASALGGFGQPSAGAPTFGGISQPLTSLPSSQTETGNVNYSLGLSQPTQTSYDPDDPDIFLDLNNDPASSLWMGLTGQPAQPTVSAQIPFTPLTATEGAPTVTRVSGGQEMTPAPSVPGVGGGEDVTPAPSRGRGKRIKKKKKPYTPSTPSPPSPASRSTY